MKATRKLIPAIVMLLVSAIVLSTASYAWFSMNTSVDVAGISIKAVNDAPNLIISGDGTTWNTSLALSHSDIALLPVTTESDDGTGWKFAYSNDPTKSTGAGQTLVYYNVDEGDLSKYVLKQDFYFSTEKQENADMYNLVVGSITIPENKGITVLLVGPDGAKKYTTSSDAPDTEVLVNQISFDKTISAPKVTAYIYFDGENTNVYANNIVSLTGAIELTFTASVTNS